jgi:pimeloyl-ACP methyl ester carboxylesterase
MPYATNRHDATRIYFEDEGGAGVPVVLHGGIVDSTELLQRSPIAEALPAGEFRLIFVDHRGVGRSDRPHEPDSYKMNLRVADATAVLDVLDIERAHFIGTSWGGRLGFGIGEYAPERVRSLVIGGQQPYAIDPEGPLARVVTEALATSTTEGIETFVRALEDFSGVHLPEAHRVRYLENDPAALHAAWQCAISEGAIARDLTGWRLSCLIFVGSGDEDFQHQARRAAREIPGATFISIQGQDHLAAHFEHDVVRPAILSLLRGTAP